MSGGVAGGPNLWTRSVIDEKGVYLGSGWVNTPCAQNSAEFGNRHRCKPPRLQCHLHNPDIKSRMVMMCYDCGDLNNSDNCMIDLD